MSQKRKRKLMKRSGVNRKSNPPDKAVEDVNYNNHFSVVWKSIEILAAIIFAVIAGLLGTLGHPISSLIFTALSVILGLALVANIVATRQNRTLVWVLFFTLCLALLVGTASLSWSLWSSEDRFSGLLTPANDPFPPFPREDIAITNFPPNCMFLFTGGGVHIVRTNQSFVLIRAGGKDILTLNWTKTGAAISGEFFGKNGNIVAVVETNKFVVNRLNCLTKTTPDRHTLIVRDQQNVEVINLRFLNQRAFVFTGTIRLPNKEEVTITKTFFKTGPIKVSGDVGFNNNAAYLFR